MDADYRKYERELQGATVEAVRIALWRLLRADQVELASTLLFDNVASLTLEEVNLLRSEALDYLVVTLKRPPIEATRRWDATIGEVIRHNSRWPQLGSTADVDRVYAVLKGTHHRVPEP